MGTIGVGIGKKDFATDTIKESNGEAFVFSGEAFEGLKKRKFALQSRSPRTDQQVNLIFDLLMLIADRWNANVSKTILSRAWTTRGIRSCSQAKGGNASVKWYELFQGETRW